MFNIVLAEDTEFLDETIVIGYGVQRKSDLTGAVASVRSEDLENRSVTDAAFQPIDAKYDVGFKAGQHEFFPYPTSVMDKNPNIVQNPGWEGK